jgi:hypothetical protein
MVLRNLFASLGKAIIMTLSVIRGAALLAVVALVATTSAQPPLPPPTPVPDQQDANPVQDAKAAELEQPEPGVKVADKGPIHEAFAQPGAETRGKGLTAPKAPPKPIPELPPDTKPEGENVRWVPGYWHWDAEKEDFLWISGFWRNVPAGRTWQAGEWIEKNGSWTYTPGFWRPTDMNNWRVDLPEPPKPVESGPSTPPENQDAVWVPGGWEYRDGQYAWRAGYWAHPNGNQVWQPGQYLASGSGYSYVPGYWDYPLEERGMLYAPVYFTEPLWQTPGWYYRPRFAFNLGFGYGWGTGAFFGSLFYGPGFNNYYYGNYYNPWYNGGGGWGGFWGPTFGFAFGFGSAWGGWGGYCPWWKSSYGYHNCLWNHYCHLNKGNPNWAGQVQAAGVARAVGAAGRTQTGAARTGAARAIGITPSGGVAGVGTAARAAARTATATTSQRPLIQPASQVARSMQAGRATSKAGASAAGSVPRGGNNAAVTSRPGGAAKGGIAVSPTGRAVQSTPTHAGSVNITPSGGRPNNSSASSNLPAPKLGGDRASIPNAGGNQPAPKLGGGRPGNPVVSGSQPAPKLGGATQPSGPTIRYGNSGNEAPRVQIRPDGSAAGRPATPSLPNNASPTIRSGNLPGNPAGGQPSFRGGDSGGRSVAPQIRPSAPSQPQFRPQSIPSRPSGPAMRPSGGSFGGGRSIQMSPSGGRPGGSMGGARMGGGGGGGARMGGGGGGARPGGGGGRGGR